MVAVATQHCSLAGLGQVPEPDCGVPGGCDEGLVAAGEEDTGDVAGVATQEGALGPGGEIPGLDSAVAGA